MRNQESSTRQTTIVVCSVAALLLLSPFVAQNLVSAREDDSIATLRGMGKAFASVAGQTSPAVVGIKAEREVAVRGFAPGQSPFDFFGGDPFDLFRMPSPRQQSPQPERKQRRTAQGSGFIISDDGYILTNNHVVESADEVEVELADERTFTAKIVGTDPESDVAVLKIKGKNLPALKLADSDALEVGEWVLAIGNPLGLSHTVTAGIVSAKGRTDMGLTTYENFIQTDAAINFGNSGGPLVNLDGKVVGINTAIAGSTGNIGIGFAIPINMARNIYEQIKDNGEVVRGFLGVLPQDLTPEMAQVFGLDNGKGTVIAEVTPDSAADKAGLKHNDVVLELNGKTIVSASDFRNRIARYKPDTKVKLVVWRDNKRKEITVKLDKRPPRDDLLAERGVAPVTPDIGFSVENLTEELAERFGYDGEAGVVVSRVESDSDAYRKGLRPGTLIKEVNREVVRNTKEFSEEMKKAKEKGKALLLIKSDRYTSYVVIDVKED